MSTYTVQYMHLKAMQNVVIKKIDLQRDFAAGVNLSEAENPIPPPSGTLYAYSILIQTGREEGGGGQLNQRER
jgi:hypothetical protein